MVTGNSLSDFDSSSGTPENMAAEVEVWFRASIAYHLRNSGIEHVDSTDFLGPPSPSRRFSGAIFLSLNPRQLQLFIIEARISIALGLQRQLGDERYRMRLAAEPHYRALRPHLSESFRILMVRPSNWSGYRLSPSRGSALAVAYQNEIQRIEMEFLMAPKLIRH
jgi:hypothetical protein